MIAEHGRKFAASMIGIICVMILAILGMGLSAFDNSVGPVAGGVVPVAIGSIAGIVATFITGNSAVSFAYARSDMTRTDESRQITERRDAASGIEPTP